MNMYKRTSPVIIRRYMVSLVEELSLVPDCVKAKKIRPPTKRKLTTLLIVEKSGVNSSSAPHFLQIYDTFRENSILNLNFAL